MGIPTIKDRLGEAAAAIVLEAIFEADLQDFSYGFRPKRDAHPARERVRQIPWRGYRWVVDVDVQGYFDAIPHEKLMKMVAGRVSDGALPGHVKEIQKAPIQEDGTLVRPKTGTPRGGTASPLLANVHPNSVDRLFQRHKQRRKLPVRSAPRWEPSRGPGWEPRSDVSWLSFRGEGGEGIPVIPEPGSGELGAQEPTRRRAELKSGERCERQRRPTSGRQVGSLPGAMDRLGLLFIARGRLSWVTPNATE